MQLKSAYLIPGLGLNHEVFQELELHAYTPVYLNWIEPQKFESFKHYILRFIHHYQLKERAGDIIIGHSFGGVLAQEIASRLTFDHTIIISSIKSKSELPFKLAMFNSIPFHQLLRKWHIRYSFPFWRNFHDYNTPSKRKLFNSCIDLHSDYYFKWSIKKLIQWKGDMKLNNLLHIHGDKDNTFPISLIKEAIIIKGGSHLMLLSQAKQINGLLDSILNK